MFYKAGFLLSVWREWQGCDHLQTEIEPLPLAENEATAVAGDVIDCGWKDGNGGTLGINQSIPENISAALRSDSDSVCHSPVKNKRRGWLVKKQSLRTIHIAEKVCNMIPLHFPFFHNYLISTIIPFTTLSLQRSLTRTYEANVL